MDDEQIQRIQQIYGLENWSGGYFDLNADGHIIVRPQRGDSRFADLYEIVEYLQKDRRLTMPMMLRFPQLLANQLRTLSNAYRNAIREYGYKGQHYPVFPMKVNPRKEVVEEFLRDSERLQIGLECGSKPELYAALAQTQSPDSLMVCNGFKDESFIELALLGTQAGKRVVIVVEKLNELKAVLRLAAKLQVMPYVGLRAKLYSRGSGKWASSGGEAAKFGLTTSELLQCVRMLNEAGHLAAFKLLHYHIGSQITDIKRVKNAMKEAARVYAKLRKMGCQIEYMDIGGGLGVDYDGSKTRFESSMNYTVQEFANDAVYVIQNVCDDENVPHPNLVTESGRMMTAYHAVLITSIRDEIETFADDEPEVQLDPDDPQVIYELKSLYDEINLKNYDECYHDALEHKDELHTQFNLGLISLEDRAKGEVLFWEICAKAEQLSHDAKTPPTEFEELRRILAAKYLCNFSLFRSAPDSWAIGQLFPIMPIHRLQEPPDDYATLVDVTCDSDGQIDKFVDLRDIKTTLELHQWDDRGPYYLAIFLVGAYQEVMGSHHNLFGMPSEAYVVIDQDGRYHITRIVAGSKIADMTAFARYDRQQLLDGFRKQLEAQVAGGKLTLDQSASLLQQYEAAAQRSTYLD